MAHLIIRIFTPGLLVFSCPKRASRRLLASFENVSHESHMGSHVRCQEFKSSTCNTHASAPYARRAGQAGSKLRHWIPTVHVNQDGSNGEGRLMLSTPRKACEDCHNQSPLRS